MVRYCRLQIIKTCTNFDVLLTVRLNIILVIRVLSWLITKKDVKRLLFHVNSGYTPATQCYFYAYIACLIWRLCWQILL